MFDAYCQEMPSTTTGGTRMTSSEASGCQHHAHELCNLEPKKHLRNYSVSGIFIVAMENKLRKIERNKEFREGGTPMAPACER
jgi:hypothetical protein